MGMFRSGTTLTARMFNMHRNIVCASDPFRPFFNLFRDEVARESDIAVNEFDPLGDYFADEEELELFEAVQESSLDKPFPDSAREQLLENIMNHAEDFSPKITKKVDSIEGDTFREVYDDLWSHVSAAYGGNDEAWEATKEVWTTEFTPVLAREYPQSKFLHVMRDPRAVCASKNVQEETKYPWLFLIRQWRKLTILSELYRNRFEERVHVVRYEDLVQSPRETSTEVCNFLNIDLDETILDPSNFLDGSGDQWLQNTSYDKSKASFDTSSVDKWRDVLQPKEVRFIEQLCAPEMSLFEYERDTDGFELPDDILLDPPQVATSELADWITEYYGDWSTFDHVDAVGEECVRQRVIDASEEDFSAIPNGVLKPYFLDPAYASTARKQMQ